tara:strand:+ start:276 stop:488 length:213 start_codon:yes stop_codon:yes gene_type:complete
MNIQKHSHDGFTISDYVETKKGQEVYIRQRYILHTTKEAKSLFKQICKEVKKSNKHYKEGCYLEDGDNGH